MQGMRDIKTKGNETSPYFREHYVCNANLQSLANQLEGLSFNVSILLFGKPVTPAI